MSKGMGKKQSINIYEAMIPLSLSNTAFHQGIPFSQISHFAGIQAIIENVAEARRIHIIDHEIRSWQHWMILMQALLSQKECPLELLKITAVRTTSKQLIEDTGKRLTSFAQTTNIPFSFKIVMVTDMLDLKEDFFELDAEETVAVFSEYLLTSLIALPKNLLDAVMKVIRNSNPCIMVVTEVKANHNSPVFVNRVIEVLFYLSAYFDCLDACMEWDDPNRMIAESMFFGEAITNVLASEGEERNIRNVKIDVWRAFITRFGMQETELSMSSLYQANPVVKCLWEFMYT